MESDHDWEPVDGRRDSATLLQKWRCRWWAALIIRTAISIALSEAIQSAVAGARQGTAFTLGLSHGDLLSNGSLRLRAVWCRAVLRRRDYDAVTGS